MREFLRVLFQSPSSLPILQADSNLKESLTVLRKENSALMMEMIELRNDISLRDEQVRSTIASFYHYPLSISGCSRRPML
jgi:hypothetical protein